MKTPIELKAVSRILGLSFATLLIAGCSKSPSENHSNASGTTPIAEAAPAELTGVTNAAETEATSQTAVTATNASAEAVGEKPVLEVQIYYVQHSARTKREKAQEFFRMFNQLDRQGQRKVAHAAVKEVEDADYEMIQKYLLDRDLHPQVLSVFMTDTLKRKDAVRLPVLLKLARLDGHPLQIEARALLHSLLQKSLGTDWEKWSQAVQMQLASNTN